MTIHKAAITWKEDLELKAIANSFYIYNPKSLPWFFCSCLFNFDFSRQDFVCVSLAILELTL